MSDTLETDAVWKGNDIVKQVMTSRRLERERDDLRERYESTLKERDSWRMRAEEKWAMRRELEELLDVNQAAASDEQFKKGLNSLKEIIRERDEARHEIEGWRNKWNWAIEMAARAEMERDDALAMCELLREDIRELLYEPPLKIKLRKQRA
jgi:hypothetical protein